MSSEGPEVHARRRIFGEAFPNDNGYVITRNVVFIHPNSHEGIVCIDYFEDKLHGGPIVLHVHEPQSPQLRRRLTSSTAPMGQFANRVIFSFDDIRRPEYKGRCAAALVTRAHT